MMRALKGVWFGYAAIGVALVAAVGCKGESTTGDDDGKGDGNGGYCGEVSGLLNDCDMAGLLDVDECEEPNSVESRCTFKCFLDASCQDLRSLICSSIVSPVLQECADACLPEPFTCGDGTAVSEFGLCDGFPDCADGSDEIRCPTFTCDSGETLPESYECDYFEDCLDGSDEHARCPGFTCGSGERVPESFECDAEIDCPDGSDEHARCPTIPCADGTTVPGRRCDDIYDCFDLSDEPANCPPSAEERICGTQ
jgi:hypothetical protein